MQLTPEQVQSVNVLLSAVQVAQRRGAFSLQDASTLQEAIDRLVPREEQDRQAAEAAATAAAQEEEDMAPVMDETSQENEDLEETEDSVEDSTDETEDAEEDSE